MIGFVKGNFVKKTPAMVLVDVNGVGYEVNISLHTYSKIQHLESGRLLTQLLIREDAHILYGFAEEEEKEMFSLLLSVSGIGAGTARMMLSYMKPDELSRAIIEGNARQLEGIKGIGKKSAERVVLELKDKLIRHPIGSNISMSGNNSLQADALNALVALGINRQNADAAIRKIVAVSPDLEVETLIKKALQNL